MGFGISEILKWGLARLTGAQRTAAVTGVLGETAAGAFVNGAGAAVFTRSGTTTTFPGDTTSSGLLRASLGGFVGGIGVGWNSPNTLTVPSGGRLDFGSSGINSPDLIVLRGAANTLEQRNGANAQTLRVFNAGDSANGEWAQISWQSNNLLIGAAAAGSGQLRSVRLTAFSTQIWSAFTYFATEVGTVGIGIVSRSNGVASLIDASGSDFGRLQFGGASSSYPSLKRSSATLQVRLADDSAFADFQARSLIANSVSRVIPVPVGSLPSASASGAGAEATVNDATSPAWGATVAGGGAVTVGVRSNGTNWIVF